MVKIGDFVTRKKYNNDIIFRIYDIKDNVAFLYGVNVRLCADANMDDLFVTNYEYKQTNYKYKRLDKNQYFYIPGKILHIDSDTSYMKQCNEQYKLNHITYRSYYLIESNFENKIIELYNNFKPDIVVITGHDSYSNGKYKNSSYFINAIKKLKSVNKNICIIAGACQSDFINLINAGASFATSPKHINIDAIDPAIVAINIALTNENEIIDIEDIINKTRCGIDGFGGLYISGKMKKGIPRVF